MTSETVGKKRSAAKRCSSDRCSCRLPIELGADSRPRAGRLPSSRIRRALSRPNRLDRPRIGSLPAASMSSIRFQLHRALQGRQLVNSYLNVTVNRSSLEQSCGSVSVESRRVAPYRDRCAGRPSATRRGSSAETWKGLCNASPAGPVGFALHRASASRPDRQRAGVTIIPISIKDPLQMCPNALPRSGPPSRSRLLQGARTTLQGSGRVDSSATAAAPVVFANHEYETRRRR